MFLNLMRLPIVFFVFAYCNLLSAQINNTIRNDIKFKNYSTADGLSQISVTSIAKDGKGFMWFGTRYGVNKFDGYSFKNYNYKAKDGNSISNNWVTNIVSDKNGNIWIGTKKGLNKYSNKKDNFIRISLSDKIFYDKEIADIYVKDSTHLLISTNKGLDFFNIDKNKFEITPLKKVIQNNISSYNVKKIFISKAGEIFIATNKKIDYYNPKSKLYTYISYPNDKELSLNTIISFFENEQGEILLGYDQGLNVFDKKNQNFKPFVSKYGKIISDPVRDISLDSSKNLWVGTYTGLYKYDNKNKLTKYTHDITNPSSLSQNSIYDIFTDNSDGLWIGTWAGGISYYNKNSNNFSTYKEGFNQDNLNYKVVSSFLQVDKNTFWIGTEGGGINIFNKKENSFTFIKNNPKNANSISSNNVKALLKDSFGHIWVGTHGGGLNKIIIDKSSTNFIRYKALVDNKITTIFEDANKNIWIGTNEGGLNLYDRASNTFKPIRKDENIGSFIYHIIKADENYIYVASNKGFAKVHIGSKDIQSVNFRLASKSTFLIKTVTSIYKDNQNNIWVGTGGDGLYNYNEKTNKSVRYGLENGLVDEFIHSVLQDDSGNIWISTNRGLSSIDLKSKKIKNFQQEDGLQSNEFNFNASLKTAEGNLFFGGIEGFSFFNPKTIQEDTFISPINIRSFQLRNESKKIFSDSIQNLILEYNQNDFNVDYIALNYSKPSKIKYAYILEGFDKDWNFVGNKKTASYTNLKPNKYTFKVKASNSEGNWLNENQASFQLTIKRPIWSTYWAYSLYFIITFVILWLGRRYELLRIKNKNDLRQERLDKVQLKEINKLKLQLFTNISHDFRTPLTLIIGPLKKLINENKGDKEVQDKLNLMYRNAQTLLQLINQLLDFRKSEAGKLNIKATKNDLVTFVEDCKLSFEDLATNKKIKYKFYVAEEIEDIWFDKIEMKKVILNILSNAFKFTPENGSIIIIIKYAQKDKSKVKIEISDSGKGISGEVIENVFDRYFQLGQKNENRSGTGVGLALAKDIVVLHSGRIYVESEIDKGTVFNILLSTGNKHFKKNEILVKENTENEFKDYNSSVEVQSGWVRKEAEISNETLNAELQTILIVEDNTEVRSFINDIFKDSFNVIQAKNGLEGLEASKNHDINVIVSDLMMPKMDGLEMAKILKSDLKTSHIPIIMLTARTSSKVQKKGYETGADVYITKPFDAEALKLQVSNILSSRKSLIEKFKKDILIEPKEITLVSADEMFLKNAMEIIEQNFSNPDFNVNSFTDKMFMSQSLLYRKIKILTGQSISEFIRTVRLKKASQLLIKTDMPIKSIVYDIGFNDIKYFRKCFKNSFKTTPSQYRKENRIE